MGTVRKRKDRFYAEAKVTINYKVYRDYRVFDKQSEAYLWIEQREDEMRAGFTDNADGRRTLKEALIRFRDEELGRYRSKKMVKSRIDWFLTHNYINTNLKLTQITPKIIHRYIKMRQKEVSNSTINRDNNILRAIFTCCVKEWEWLKESPFEKIRILPNPEPRNRRISPKEEALILEYLEFNNAPPANRKQIMATIFLLALETAMRLGEICAIKWKEVNFKQRYITLPITKNGTERQIPLSTRSIELLKLMKGIDETNVFPITSPSASKLFTKSVRTIGINDLQFHDTRHEACTRLARKLHVLDLARMTGHRDTKSLMIYYNPTATEIASLLD